MTATSVLPEEHGQSSPAHGTPLSRVARVFQRLSPWVAIPVALYLLLVLLGVSQSSIGIEGLREDPTQPTGTQIGGAAAIRSDEYLTSTPVALGAAATGQGDDLNPLTAPASFGSLIPATPVSSVVMFDGAALRLGPWLPDQMLFAARWWLPFLLLFLGAPAFFTEITGSREIGLFAALLMTLAPASVWWSFTPIQILGFSFAGAAALQRCARWLRPGGSVPRAVGWGLLSAVLLARTPLQYQPWAIVLVPVVLAVAIVALLLDREHVKRNALAVVGVGVLSLALAGVAILENRVGVMAAADTVYPGSRVETGAPSPVQALFGATSLGSLKHLGTVATNQSEVSSAYTIGIVLAVLLIATGLRYRDRAHRWALIVALAMTGAWFAWCTVSFGKLGTHLPVINLVPSWRAVAMLGYLATIVLCLALPAAPERMRRGFALLAAGTSALVAGYAGSLLKQDNLPGLPTRSIWEVSAVVALVVFLLAYRPRWWVGYAAAIVAAIATVATVNPVLVGLGDLRDSHVAQTMLRTGDAARAGGQLWASDDIFVDALLTATGVPSASTRQLTGPDVAAWERLDPGAAHAGVWNRGGSFITFVWNDDPTLTFANPGGDVIQVTGSPCALAETTLGVTTIVSSHPVSSACARQVDTFSWSGTEKFVYDLSRS